jgi:hypothetical protein
MGSKALHGENMVQVQEQDNNNLIPHLENNSGIDLCFFTNISFFYKFI